MKLLILKIIFIVGIIFCGSSTYSQNNNQSLEFTYDAAGNRIVRQVIEIQNKNNQNAGKDVKKKDSTATAGQMVDADSTQNGAGASAFADIIGDYRITIYPNPTSGSLKIQITPFQTGSSAEILLFDLQAHILLKQNIQSELSVLELSGFAGGSYILRILIGGRQSEWKIIKE